MMSSYKVLIYVALVVLVMQVVSSDASPVKKTTKTAAASGPGQCKAPTDGAKVTGTTGGPQKAGARASRGRSTSPSGRSRSASPSGRTTRPTRKN